MFRLMAWQYSQNSGKNQPEREKWTGARILVLFIMVTFILALLISPYEHLMWDYLVSEFIVTRAAIHYGLSIDLNHYWLEAARRGSF